MSYSQRFVVLLFTARTYTSCLQDFTSEYKFNNMEDVNICVLKIQL